MRLAVIGAAVAVVAMSHTVRADQAGCTVILCLSNPAGWAHISECVSPVRAALRNMAKGRFPQCTFSNGVSDANGRVGYYQTGTTTDSEGFEIPVYGRFFVWTDQHGRDQRVAF